MNIALLGGFGLLKALVEPLRGLDRISGAVFLAAHHDLGVFCHLVLDRLFLQCLGLGKYAVFQLGLLEQIPVLPPLDGQFSFIDLVGIADIE